MHRAKRALQIYKRQGAKALGRQSVKSASNYAKKIRNRFIRPGMEQIAQQEELSFISNDIFQIDALDLNSSKAVAASKLPTRIETVNWFVPYFDHLAFGGIYTIFRFIAYMDSKGVHNCVIIYDRPSLKSSDVLEQVKSAFPKIYNVSVIIFDPASSTLDDLPASDIAVCTFWVSAYFLLKFNKTKRKFYFIQDYEPLFYPGGAVYALAESTYRFGFRAIVNTPGLLSVIHQKHGINGISFVPAVDHKVYFPDPTKHNKKVRIFFYARPNNPRNAFHLGVQIIRQLVQKYGDRIEIITAGAEWDESAYGLKGQVTNLGLLKSIKEVAALYRTCDIGFVYMLSKHPSYQPFEFMASGMATVSNNNEDNLWFLQHGKNCLLAEPSPKSMAEQISELIDNTDLRNKIIKNGLKTVEGSWDTQTDRIWNDIQKADY